MWQIILRSALVISAVLVSCVGISNAQLRVQKISATEGGFTGDLVTFSGFGQRVANIGDIDGDGMPDLAVTTVYLGVRQPDLWILFLDPDVTVARSTGIDTKLTLDTSGGNDHYFSIRAIDTVGDLDGDGAQDIVLLGPGYTQIYFLDSTGDVKSVVDQRPASGGRSLANYGGPAQNGLVDLAICCDYRGPPGQNDPNSAIDDHLNVFTIDPGFREVRTWPVFRPPESQDASNLGYGRSIVTVGDLDNNGFVDLAIGQSDQAFGAEIGRMWITFIDSDSLNTHQKITLPDGSLYGELVEHGDLFGASVANVGDLDGDGVIDIIVGAPGDGDGGFQSGALWILFLNRDGTAKGYAKIGAANPELAGLLSEGDSFGHSVANMGDLDGDGMIELAAGVPGDDDGGQDRGAVWILSGLEFLPPYVRSSAVEARLGTDLVVSADVATVGGISRVEVSFRRSGDPTFFDGEMVETAHGSYTFSTPAFAVSHTGVEYFVTATSSTGVETRWPESGFASVPVIVSEGITTEIRGGAEASAYRLFSIPLDLDDSSARAVFEDDLGSYDRTAWRFFEWSAGVLQELDEQAIDIVPGEAFWLLSKDARRNVNTGAGKSVRTDVPFRKAIARGWNLVGNPFGFSIPLSKIRTASGRPLDIRVYQGSWSEQTEPIQPFEGYAVFSESPDTLIINPDIYGPDEDEPRVSTASADDVEWAIQIVARLGDALDDDNFAAVSKGAEEGWDRMDKPEPPLIGDWVSVSFPHPDWERATSAYSTDVRPAVEEGNTWTFQVVAGRAAPVHLRFNGLENVPDDHGVWVVDETLRTRRQIHAGSEYTVSGVGVSAARSFKLIVGTSPHVEESLDDVAEIPSGPELLESYPNPFRGSVTIAYSLPREADVTVSIYNLLGERVAVASESGRTAPGPHSVVWDGRSRTGADAPSGVYLVRLESDTESLTQSIVLAR